MYLIVTRSFPPELGGMQSLMWGLARELSKNFMIKVFADYVENHKEFDEQATFSIERVGGPKLLRKYRKAYLIDEFIKNGKVNGIIADHWKSLEHLKTNKKKYCLIHGKEINHAKGSGINERLLKVLNNVEKVIANSKYTKNLAIEIGVKEENIIKYVNKLQPTLFVSFKKSDEESICYFKGSFSESIIGKSLADQVAKEVGLQSQGKSHSLLKNTKSVSLVIFGRYYQREEIEHILRPLLNNLNIRFES